MVELECPADSVLAAFAVGGLGKDAAHPILQHVEQCPACRALVNDLTRAAIIRNTNAGRNQSSVAAAERQETPQVEALLDSLTENADPSAQLVPEAIDQDTAWFLKCLRRAAILTPEDLHEVIADAATTDARTLARNLVRRQKLTRYQARVLLLGKPHSLTLGQYVIEDQLGQGGMGVVFRARHLRMNRTVALKVLNPKSKQVGCTERFRREVQTIGRLQHPNIVAAYDADLDSGTPFLVLEYVDGIDLKHHVSKRGPLDVALALRCIRQAAEGLAYAHDQGIVHRDIKPGNLLLDNSGNVKLLDLGLARLDDAFLDDPPEDREDLTQTGTVMGTVDYMSPEQALNTKHADRRSDVYSLGCTLFFLLTGEPLYAGDTIMERLIAHREQPIPQLSDHRDDIPPAVQALLERMVEKDPDKRIQSMQEVANLIGERDGTLVSLQLPVPENRPAELQFPALDFLEMEPFEEPLVQGGRLRQRPRAGRRWDYRWWMPIPLAVGAIIIMLLVHNANSGSPPPVRHSAAAPAAGDEDDIGKISERFPKPVLLVLPSHDFLHADYLATRNAFEDRQVLVTTASAASGYAVSRDTYIRVPIDVQLEDVSAQDYSAVVFCGGNVKEFRGRSHAGREALRIARQMADYGRPISAICNGSEILRYAGFLANASGATQVVAFDSAADAPRLVEQLSRMVPDQGR